MTEQTENPGAGNIRLSLTLIATAAVAVLVILVLPQWLKPQTGADVELTPPECDLGQGSCRIEQGDVRLTFSLGPEPISSAKPLTAQLELDGIEPQEVLLSLEGRDMYMGLNQTLLEPSNDHRWRGQTELAVCTTGRMVWRARLRIATAAQTYTTWFDFEAN